jgi:hypothetical protein
MISFALFASFAVKGFERKGREERKEERTVLFFRWRAFPDHLHWKYAQHPAEARAAIRFRG